LEARESEARNEDLDRNGVGWVERSDTHQVSMHSRQGDGFRKGSTILRAGVGDNKRKNMLEKSEAEELVSRRLEQMAPLGEQFVVVEEKTIERTFGWIFFYNSKTFLETGNPICRLAGNGPVFVNKMTGRIDFFGSIPSLDVILAGYERNLEESS
jgi:hypothetical protein